MPQKHYWYFGWTPGKPIHAGVEKQGLVRQWKWDEGEPITVSFMDGEQIMRDRVMEAARDWIGNDAARLSFEVRDTPTAGDIRITFRYEGSWSMVGTTSRNRPKDQPTMNFGWLETTTSEEDLRAVVLHEFGHALGLIHEHQLPENGIRWNRKAVIEELSQPPNCWTLEDIETNVLRIANKSDLIYTTFDEKSIMIYPFQAAWTEDRYFVEANRELSPGDKAFVHDVYR